MKIVYASKITIIGLLMILSWPSVTRAFQPWYLTKDISYSENTKGMSMPATITTPFAIPDLPTNVLAAPSTIICGETAYLTATSNGNHIRWFTSPAGGTEIGHTLSGLAFPVSPLVSTVYYAEAYNVNSVNPNRVAVTLTVNLPSAPTAAAANPPMINCGELSELTAIADGAIINWYSTSSGGSLVGSTTSGSNLPVSPETTTTYYAETAGICASAMRSPVTVVVNPAPEPSPVSAYPATVCYGSTTDLTAFASGYTIHWYDAFDGGNFLGATADGTNFPITVYSDTTLYAETFMSNSSSATFYYTGSVQTWTVPMGVTSVDVKAYGAQGGNNGGTGAMVQSKISVVPGSVLYINIGGQGGSPAGGWNGGGMGGSVSSGNFTGGGGGGATDIRAGGNTLIHRLLVAAGGGGRGGAGSTNPSPGNGGNGGGESGSDGTGVIHSCIGSNAGLGATQSSGGSGGAVSGCGCIFAGTGGLTGVGGNGASGESSGEPGGGGAGGGGYFGGGGAGCSGCGSCSNTDLAGAGGGGGSSWADPVIAHNTQYFPGTRSGDGQLELSWTSPTCVSASRTPVFVPYSRFTEPGGISGGGIVCPGNPADTLKLTSYAGSVIKWEYSADSGAVWNTIANTKPYYVPLISGGGTFWFRAIVKSGTCPEMPSSHAVVTVPSVNGMAMKSGNSINCNLIKNIVWTDLVNEDNKLLTSVADSTGSSVAYAATACLTIDPEIHYQPGNNEPYMQRHLRIESMMGKPYKIKLYFTQDDLNQLMSVSPSLQSAWDLMVTMVSDTQSWLQTQQIIDPVLTENDPYPGVFSLEVPGAMFTEYFIQKKSVEVSPPTTLLSFEASCKNGMAQLNWATANEYDNKSFSVERTTNLTEWTEVGTVNGAGNSNRVQNYTLIDESGIKGTVYYRLKQTSVDGSINVSTAVLVNCDSHVELNVNYYPNPCSSELMVAFNKDLEKTANVMIYDASGKMVMIKVLSEEEMHRGIAILNVTDLIPGVYTVDFMSGQAKKAMNVVKN